MKGIKTMLKELLFTLLYIIIIGLIISLIFITFAYGLFNGIRSFYFVTLFFMFLLWYIMFNFHDLILHK